MQLLRMLSKHSTLLRSQPKKRIQRQLSTGQMPRLNPIINIRQRSITAQIRINKILTHHTNQYTRLKLQREDLLNFFGRGYTFNATRRFFTALPETPNNLPYAVKPNCST